MKNFLSPLMKAESDLPDISSMTVSDLRQELRYPPPSKTSVAFTPFLFFFAISYFIVCLTHVTPSIHLSLAHTYKSERGCKIAGNKEALVARLAEARANSKGESQEEKDVEEEKDEEEEENEQVVVTVWIPIAELLGLC